MNKATLKVCVRRREQLQPFIYVGRCPGRRESVHAQMHCSSRGADTYICELLKVIYLGGPDLMGDNAHNRSVCLGAIDEHIF